MVDKNNCPKHPSIIMEAIEFSDIQTLDLLHSYEYNTDVLSMNRACILGDETPISGG